MITIILLLFPLCANIVASTDSSSLPGPPIFYPVRTYPPECYLPPDSGACDTDEAKSKLRKHHGKKVEIKAHTRFYFDTITEDCYQFTFFSPHCNHNSNNFVSLDKCRSFCKLG